MDQSRHRCAPVLSGWGRVVREAHDSAVLQLNARHRRLSKSILRILLLPATSYREIFPNPKREVAQSIWFAKLCGFSLSRKWDEVSR